MAQCLMALRLSGLQKQNPLQTVGRIRRQPPSGKGAMPDGASLIRPTKAKSSANRRPDKASAAIRQWRNA
jgi:hypothetical protein